ncbi:MAG: RES family NAD+ phosphorylase [Microvirga sp.]
MTDIQARAPHPTYRLIPSRFPPIGLFDTVATTADLSAVMELVGWTNDRLVASRLARLPRQEWAYGRPNASIVMAAFLHGSPTGMRFNGPELGAWYASREIETAAVEVGHHLRREAVARNVPDMTRIYRSYAARLHGLYLDIRGGQGERPGVYAPDRYDASQAFGESVRASGRAGILYDSLRHRGGTNVVAYRPSNIREITQAAHFEIRAHAIERRLDVRELENPS